MVTDDKTTLHQTIALCPTCLSELDATVFYDESDVVWMERTCPTHGTHTTRVWPHAEHYQWLRSLAFPKIAPDEAHPVKGSCPHGCGVCSRHERRGTLFEIEVTQKCNLRCPVCFMSAMDKSADPSMQEILAMYDAIALAAGTDGAVQITGGEPTCRDDLPTIIAEGRKKGFWGIEVNTNGLKIAEQPGYLESLVEAGLTGVYLSFDGLRGEIYESTCGRDILDIKLKVIERCREAGIQVVLAATIVSGLNDTEIGDLLRFSLENIDVVVGLALQPAFVSGRFEATRSIPMSMGDVIFDLAAQSDGLIEVNDILPLGCSHPLCDTGTFLIQNPAATHSSGYYPVTRDLSLEDYRKAYNPSSPQGSVFLDIVAKQGLSCEAGLSLIIMNYMDAYSLDVQRLRECSMLVTVPDGRTIPFCSYHLVDAGGCRIYPFLGRQERTMPTEKAPQESVIRETL